MNCVTVTRNIFALLFAKARKHLTRTTCRVFDCVFQVVNTIVTLFERHVCLRSCGFLVASELQSLSRERHAFSCTCVGRMLALLVGVVCVCRRLFADVTGTCWTLMGAFVQTFW